MFVTELCGSNFQALGDCIIHGNPSWGGGVTEGSCRGSPRGRLDWTMTGGVLSLSMSFMSFLLHSSMKLITSRNQTNKYTSYNSKFARCIISAGFNSVCVED